MTDTNRLQFLIAHLHDELGKHDLDDHQERAFVALREAAFRWALSRNWRLLFPVEAVGGGQDPLPGALETTSLEGVATEGPDQAEDAEDSWSVAE